MTTAMGWVVDGKHVLHSLQEIGQKLDGADHEIVLDFSLVRRLDPSAIQALKDLAALADDKVVKIILRGVNISIYKVLKLTKVTPRFAFLA